MITHECSPLTRSGTFLTAHPSGSLTATTPSRGPLEAFKPMPTSAGLSSSTFPTYALQTSSEKYLSVSPVSGLVPGKKDKYELRADADAVGESERVRIKCQREFVLKAKMAAEGDGVVGKPGPGRGGGGSLEDEMKRK